MKQDWARPVSRLMKELVLEQGLISCLKNSVWMGGGKLKLFYRLFTSIKKCLLVESLLEAALIKVDS
jgi:hypothetical protein